MSPVADAFPKLVSAAMRERALGLRELCRRAELDPSLFSKVLAGKRNPPSEEAALRRLAKALGVDPVELIVSAGRIPEDWRPLAKDPALLRAVHQLATGRAAAPRPAVRPPEPSRQAWREPTPAPSPARPAPPKGLSEELL